MTGWALESRYQWLIALDSNLLSVVFIFVLHEEGQNVIYNKAKTRREQKTLCCILKKTFTGTELGSLQLYCKAIRGEKHISSHPSPNPTGPMLRIIWLNTKMNLCLLVWQAFNNSLWTAWHTAECLNCLKWLIYRFHKLNMLWCYDVMMTALAVLTRPLSVETPWQNYTRYRLAWIKRRHSVSSYTITEHIFLRFLETAIRRKVWSQNSSMRPVFT